MKTREQMKQEAVLAMRAIKVSLPCIDALVDRDDIWTSEDGALFDDEVFADMAREVEKEYGGLVYHIDHTRFEFGEVLSMFWISGYEEEPIEDYLEDLKDGYAFCYCKNLDADYCSEFGTISFVQKFGGVKRIS